MIELKDTKQKVKSLLIKYSHLRDSDERLIATYWMIEAGSKDALDSMTATQFLHNFVSGAYTNPESIRRVRQKLQEENESLRGKNYFKRQKLKENVRNEIRNL
jgi:hypothetical protein